MNRKALYIIISSIIILSLGIYVYLMEFYIPDFPGNGGSRSISGEGKNGSIFALDGKWYFYPNLLLLPEEIPEQADHTANIHTAWNKMAFISFSQPEIKYGTYKIILNTPFEREQMALKVPVINSAYKIFINGSEAGSMGVPGPDIINEKPKLAEAIFPFFQDSEVLEITLQISNHHNPFSKQVINQIEYGRLSDIENRTINITFLNGAISMFMFLLFLIFLIRFLSIKTDKSLLFLTVFFLINCVYQLVSQPMAIVHFFYNLPAAFLIRAEALLFIGGILIFYGYLYYYFGRMFFRRIIHGPLLIVSILSYLLILVLPLQYVQLIVTLYSFLTLFIGLVYFFIITISNFKRKKITDHYILRLLCFFFLLFPMIHDILFLAGFYRTFLLFDFSIFIFGFLQLIILADNTFSVQTTIKQYSSEIHKYEQFADNFYGFAGHELRNPIHSIVGLSESLLIAERDNILTKEQRGSIAQIAASGMRLSNQVNDLIDFSRIRTKNLSILAQPTDAYQVIELVKRITQPLTDMKNITVISELSRDTPQIYGDENRLEQVFYSFIRLGLRFMESGTIIFYGREKDDRVEFNIKFDSADIHNTELAVLLDNLKGERVPLEGFENSALSLIVLMEILKLHDTELEYKKTDDNIVFTFFLKICKTCTDEVFQESMDMNVLVNLDDGEQPAEDVKQMTVLVADDNIIDLQIIINFLKTLEINIRSVRNGEDALKEILENTPDLAILDVLMPKINGYDVCKKAREKYSSTELPIILVNNKNQGYDMMLSASVGANDFIVKPIVGEELIARVKTHLQLSKVSSLYGKFVPKELIHSLGRDNILEMQLGDQVKMDMTVFFADIRQFTRLSESMTPQENFKFINSYLARISPFIQKYNGFIDKYIGDSIMALYPKNPDDALKTAIEMMAHIHIYNGHRKNSGYNPIKIGVGIHTGSCIMGVIGDGERMQGTVISDAVNLASRIQDVTKMYGANIVISQETFVRLENPLDYNFRFLGKAKVKGKEQTVSLFEFFDGDTEGQKRLKADTKVDFETAILLFAKQQFAEAVELFQQIVERNPEDQAAVLFLDRSQKLLAISAGLAPIQ